MPVQKQSLRGYVPQQPSFVRWFMDNWLQSAIPEHRNMLLDTILFSQPPLTHLCITEIHFWVLFLLIVSAMFMVQCSTPRVGFRAWLHPSYSPHPTQGSWRAREKTLGAPLT